MNKETRATIAYIAGNLISNKQSSSIYDYETSSYYNYSI